jgi:deoxyribonuclease-4
VRLGVHVSIGGGMEKAITEAIDLGCDGFQIFAGNPRGWARQPLLPAVADGFRKRRADSGLYPCMVHLAYLPNPATADPALRQKSLFLLEEDFRRANQLGADFFVFHPGKATDGNREVAIERVIEAVDQVLERVDGPTLLLFENQAGSGSEIAGAIPDLARLISGVNEKPRIGICWDTCHAFAAGHDLRTATGWEKVLAEFESEIGLDFLKIFHLNDAMGDLGSRLDRHSHIGDGMLGRECFHYLVNHPILSQRAGILETPQKAGGDDQRNLAALRAMIGGKA